MDYPKIGDTRGCPGGRCVAFEKLDGSNLGWVWERGHGFLRATTRRNDFDGSHPVFGDAVDVFAQTLAVQLHTIFDANPTFKNTVQAKAFTEYLGANSFAGLHVPGEPKRLFLIDVWTNDLGFVGPEEFTQIFKGLPMPRVVYRGKFTGKVTDDAKCGFLKVAEGLVIKGGKTGAVWMAKVKTKTWLDKLEAAFKDGFWTDGAGIQRSVREERSE